MWTSEEDLWEPSLFWYYRRSLGLNSICQAWRQVLPFADHLTSSPCYFVLFETESHHTALPGQELYIDRLPSDPLICLLPLPDFFSVFKISFLPGLELSKRAVLGGLRAPGSSCLCHCSWDHERTSGRLHRGSAY